MSNKDTVKPFPGTAHWHPLSEQRTLGGLMVDNTVWEKVVAILVEQDFYDAKHQRIFRTIASLAKRGEPFDPVTLSEAVLKVHSGGMEAYLGTLARDTYAPENVVAYAKIVRRYALERQRLKAKDQSDWDLMAELTQRIKRLEEPDAAHRYLGYTLRELCGEPDEETRWAVPDILPEGVTILAGKPKVKKSWLALGIAMAVAQGGKALGHVDVEQGDVLYLALEDSRKRLKKRAKAIIQGGQAPERLRFVNEWPRLDEGGIAKLEEWIKKYPAARLIIIDTLEGVRPVSKANRTLYSHDYIVGSLLTPLANTYSVSILIVTHVRKMDSEDPIDLISGSLGLTGSVDGYAVLRREQGQADAFLYVNGRDLEEEMDYALTWDIGIVNWRIKGKAEDFKRSPERQTIVDLLKEHGPLSTLEIAKQRYPNTEIDHQSNEFNATKRLVYKARDDGLIERRHYDKKWWVPNKPKNSGTSGNCGTSGASGTSGTSTQEPVTGTTGTGSGFTGTSGSSGTKTNNDNELSGQNGTTGTTVTTGTDVEHEAEGPPFEAYADDLAMMQDPEEVLAP